jgi:hypothetical protein
MKKKIKNVKYNQLLNLFYKRKHYSYLIFIHINLIYLIYKISKEN